MSDFSLRTTPTFVHQALLFVGAIPDALLVFRGASCVHEKIYQTLQDHDYLPAGGEASFFDRVRLTSDPYTVTVTGSEGLVIEAAQAGLAERPARAVILAELSRVSVAGESLRQLAQDVAHSTGVPCLCVRSQRFERDFTAALSALLLELARVASEGERGPLRPERVAILGYNFLRGEGDAQGDVAELERLVTELGLQPTPTWLSGRGFDELLLAATAGTLVALPGARPAAERLAARTGARVLSLPLPVGIAGTNAWLRALGAELGVAERAEAVIARCVPPLVRALDRMVTTTLVGRRALLCLTGEWLGPTARCFGEELGIEVVGRVLRERQGPAEGETSEIDAWDPSVSELRRRVTELRGNGGLDFVVGSHWERQALDRALGETPLLEFGFPQRHAHFLRPAPHLGYAGVLTWAERLFALATGGERR